MTTADGRLCLNPNVEITPVADFPAEVRARLGGGEGDYVLSEHRARYAAQRIDAETARFIDRFREPCGVVDAVIAHSADTAEDPAELLAQAFPLVARLRSQRVLIAPGSAEPVSRMPCFAPGARVGGAEILTCVDLQTETEVYRVRMPDGAPAALKWAPSSAPAFVRDGLRREREVLEHLSGTAGAPEALGGDLDGETPFLLLSWRPGVDLLAFAASARPLSARIEAAAGVIEAYAALHAAGVLHGDLHPRNVLASDEGAISLIDFGAARRLDRPDDGPRVGLLPDYEPEAARDALAGRPLPLSSPAGEQYGVAALAYRILTGAAPLLLSLEAEAALRQIVDQPPRAFAEFGLVWPSVEAVLARALAKDPADRHASVAAFAAALGEALRRPPVDHTPPAGRERAAPDILAAYGLDGPLLATPPRLGPTASLYYGAAGAAWALLRCAVAREDPAALAAAELWIQRGLAERGAERAFLGPELGVLPEAVGPFSLFNGEPGLHVVRALVSEATGDREARAGAVSDFVHLAERGLAVGPGFDRDTMNGAASLLLGAALLADGADARLTALGDRLARAVVGELAAAKDGYLGLAHGEAGAIHALLRWREAAGPGDDAAIRAALVRLDVAANPDATWPLRRGDADRGAWTGWCHGSAGHILLWSAAARAFDDAAYADRAVGAGRFLCEHGGQDGPSLCCGRAGGALSLFELGRLTGEAAWFARGRDLLDGAAAAFHPPAPHSLFRGRLGVDLARLEAERPEGAAWPICRSPL